MCLIIKKLFEILDDIQFCKKVYVIIGLISWMPPALSTLYFHLSGIYFSTNTETTPLPFVNQLNVVYVPIAILNIIALICLFRNVVTYFVPIWLAVLGIWCLVVNASLGDHYLNNYSNICHRFALVIYSLVNIWFAYDLAVIRWNCAKKEGNEAPVEVEEGDKMISRDKVDQKDGDQVTVVCL